QPGAPYNVQVSNNTSLNFDPNRSSTTLSAQGNATIDGGSTLTLGNSIGGDLDLYGNWTNHGPFNGASRSVNFKVSGAQTATAAGSQSCEVRDASIRAPVDLSTTTGFSDFDITASTAAGDHLNSGTSGIDATKSVNRNYSLSSSPASSFGSSDVTCHFDPSDVD